MSKDAVIVITEDFRLCFAETLSHEGGFVNHPLDPGGMTNLGVTRKTWAAWTGRKVSEVSEEEMRALTAEKVVTVYHRNYWQAVRGDDLPRGVNMMVFDIAVNSGPSRAVRMLQKGINGLGGRVKVSVDGRIGPKTIAAAVAADSVDLIKEIANTRLWFYFDLSTFRTFGKGWMRRLMDISIDAGIMVTGRAPAMVMSRRVGDSLVA